MTARMKSHRIYQFRVPNHKAIRWRRKYLLQEGRWAFVLSQRLGEAMDRAITRAFFA
jgi:hypothetical protein